VDPILDQYIGNNATKQINSGVFNSKNLGLYGYSFHNPVVLMDPDGKDVKAALLLISESREAIKAAANKNGVSAQAIASIVFQEKKHTLGAKAKNNYILWLDDGVNDQTPKVRSYGIGEMQLGLAAELLGKDIKVSGVRKEVFDLITTDNALALDLIGRNLANAKAEFGELTVFESAIFHNAGEEGLRSFRAGDKLKGGIYDRSTAYQGAIRKALIGDISPRKDTNRRGGIPRPKPGTGSKRKTGIND